MRTLHAEETPPRAWGRPSKEDIKMAVERNTPTGVGKTGVRTCHRPFA
ncbi:hypothetical protein BMETH_147_12 [methanotrophic bacterial endosymbiont of Bathymodiolus sp.]|nr:hypothetical protein BMETH_147_12 [methanotrophic bacterial endosymbiont of Bathymodiolus sp.]